MFADYFEPDGVYQVRVGWNCPEGTLLKSSESQVKALGVNLMELQLLMEMDELEWSMDEFWEKAADFAPTLVLIKMKNGTVCGGVAGVSWPKSGGAADPAKGSFIFSLGATPARFDLIGPEGALFCGDDLFGFGCEGDDLFVYNDGDGCGSCDEFEDDQSAYTGPRGKGQLVGATVGDTEWYERWELWRL
jgi:hypothetical protein